MARNRSNSPDRRSGISNQIHESASRKREGGQVGGGGQRRAPAELPRQIERPKKLARKSKREAEWPAYEYPTGFKKTASQ